MGSKLLMVHMPDANELQALQTLLAQLQERNAALDGELRVVRTERDLLQEQLNRFKRRLFEARSEASTTAGQKDLFFDEAEREGAGAAPAGEEAARNDSDNDNAAADELQIPAHRRAKRGRKPLDAALPREVVRHELPEAERVCPKDGAALAEIGVEVSEQLDIVPQQVRVIRHERVKYACPCCDGGLRLAPKAPQLIPKSLLTEAALAWVASAKYQDGLPLYRQAALLGRFGGTTMSRNTLAASIVRAGHGAQPVVNLLRDLLLDSPVIYGDETEVQVLKEPGKKPQTKSYMWVQTTEASGVDGTGPPIRLFGYSAHRSLAAARGLYEGVRAGAVLMSDGYEPYAAIAAQYQLVHLGCWAHARRYVHEAWKALPKDRRGPEQLTTRLLDLIGKLYHVQAEARRAGLDAQALLERRTALSRPVLDRIRDLVAEHLHSVLPASLLGKALHYLSAQWPKLVRYVDDGRYPIDNNACENAIRPFCVGRRNWLFSDTVGGATASANLYSLLQTCQANGVDGYRYLKALFVGLPKARTVEDFEALLPWKIVLEPR
jgi:transposase